jgi:hypothetical protein
MGIRMVEALNMWLPDLIRPKSGMGFDHFGIPSEIEPKG